MHAVVSCIIQPKTTVHNGMLGIFETIEKHVAFESFRVHIYDYSNPIQETVAFNVLVGSREWRKESLEHRLYNTPCYSTLDGLLHAFIPHYYTRQQAIIVQEQRYVGQVE